jgi:photosystem II stability/assembly factor-like uncharacterized protein
VTPEERDLRQALNARSGEASPEFRARLSATLAEGRPASNLLPALALAAAVTLTVGTIGVLLLARQARGLPTGSASASPRVSATPTPTPTPTPSPSPGPPFVAGVLAAPSSPIVLPGTAQLSAPSNNVVWAFVVDQYLYRSTDRGVTWQQRPLPPSYASFPQPEISFVSDSEGWLNTGGSPDAQCNAEAVGIWHTTDAGGTWQLLGSSGVAPAQCKGHLSFVDSNRGFLDRWDPNHAPVIYRTTDGGRSWTASSPLPDPPGFTSQPGSYLRAGFVHAFGSTLLVTATAQNSAGSFEFVFRSTDGGATWQDQSRAADPNNNVVFVIVNRWLQLIAPGQSVETTNGGASWHRYPSDYSQAAPIAADFVFGDSQVGYATVRGGISRTVDGGLHWRSLHTPGT